MFWGYVGGGTWERQRLPSSGLVGNIYGNKFDDRARLAVEVVWDRKVMATLWEEQIEDASDLDWCKMRVEAQIENLLRRDWNLVQIS